MRSQLSNKFVMDKIKYTIHFFLFKKPSNSDIQYGKKMHNENKIERFKRQSQLPFHVNFTASK